MEIEQRFEALKLAMQRALSQLPERKRFLFPALLKEKSHFILKGVRGAGKTTLLLQLALAWISEGRNVFYFSADRAASPSHLIPFLSFLASRGYSTVIVDEVAYIPQWQEQVKEAVDEGVVEQLIISSSSPFSLQRAHVDLSRRFILYHLPPFSLREYVYFTTGKELPVISLKDIMQNWWRFLSYPTVPLEEYLFHTLPFYREPGYKEKLDATLQKMLTTDLLAYRMTTSLVHYAKPLFEYLSRSRGNEVSYGKMASALGISKGSVATLLQAFVDMGLVIEIPPCLMTSGRVSRKRYTIVPPFRMLFHHLVAPVERGMLREDFFAHHLSRLGPLCYEDVGDFRFKDYLFEIGGPYKRKAALKGRKGYIVVESAMPEEGIPLHLFGYLF